ncbi:diguanylate cyclase (GGDEF) domain-containing protein [Idiomarina sp. A28L]|uniref:GGDEF domain-containing protein n=1 Tax=Idiomarina sp. A28L TaxID=1036674 RepID=UPI0002138625|nr:sensor domain-containing diguanylate cyclase [Idiomarina sp. A28L]EGN75591.1 diguanylate cyclase (GGDEF) domain-containing protein [Idiomarina sp. A28L]
MSKRVSESKKALSDPNKNLNDVISVTPGVIFQLRLDANGELSFRYASPKLIEDTNCATAIAAESVKEILKLIHTDDLEYVKDSILTAHKNSLPWQCDFRIPHNDQNKWIRGKADLEKGSDNSSHWNGVLLDISDLKAAQLKLQESEQRLQEAQTLASIGHWYAKIETGEVYWSDIVFKIFGLEQAHTSPSIELINRHVHPDDVNILKEGLEQAKATGKLDIEYRIIRPNGTIGWVHSLGEINHLNGISHGTIQDITEQKADELELQELATTDPLTKLYNRRFFIERSESAIKLCNRLERPLSVVMFDLDRFKVVNDTYGHATGDVVLEEISREVKASLRSEDVLGRIGGEEFAITMPDTNLMQGVKVAEKLRMKIEQMKFKSLIDDQPFQLTCSFGVTEKQTAKDMLEKLLSQADSALYLAKHNGRNRVETKL